VTEGFGRGGRQLLDYLNGTTRYSNLKEETTDHSRWRTRFGRGFGPVVKADHKMNDSTTYGARIKYTQFCITDVTRTKQNTPSKQITCIYRTEKEAE